MSQNNPKVSVIIPVYNVEKYLRECLDSVVNQTLRDIEIICVDDGSTDSSPEILREYAEKDSRVKVYTQENINAGAARNTGLSNATGEYLSFLDSDDFFELNAIERMYECAKIRKAEIVVYQVSTFYENTGRSPFLDLRYNKKLLPEKEVFSYSEIEQNAFLAIKSLVWDKLIKRELVTKYDLHFQSVDVFNDIYFAYTALLSAESITILEEQLVHYRKRAAKNSITDKRYLHIDCAHTVLFGLKDFLIKNDLYKHYERDFINFAIHLLHIDYIADNRNDFSKQHMREKIRLWLDEFGVHGYSCSYYYDLRKYQNLLETVLVRESKPESVEYSNSKTVIPVVYATDLTYMRFVLTSMVSALQYSKSNTFYNFIILIPRNSGIDQSDVRKRIRRFDNFSLSFIEIGDEFSSIQLQIDHITTPTFYRLRLPGILDKYDKCIYLDADTIVCEDLQWLYDIDLADNYLAGVPAYGYYKQEEKHRERLGIREEFAFQYINAGVLLFNLNKMREDDKESQFIQLLDRNYASQDQDILNVACFGKIRLLPYRYNVMTKYAKWKLETFPSEAIPYEIISGRMYPAIIHYADKTKPWKDYSSPYSNYWFSAAMTDMCWDLFPDISILKKRQTVKEDAVPNVKNVSKETRKSIPRKVRGGVQCYRDHGAGYTVRRTLYHIGLWEDEENPSYDPSKINLRVPDKLSGGIQCYRDHGVGYTLRRVLYHMGLWEDEEAPNGPENRPKLISDVEHFIKGKRGKKKG